MSIFEIFGTEDNKRKRYIKQNVYEIPLNQVLKKFDLYGNVTKAEIKEEMGESILTIKVENR